MKVLVILDGTQQDLELGVSIDAMMTQAGWQAEERFSFAYTKDLNADELNIEEGIKKDVDAATFESEWKDVKYVYVIGSGEPRFDLSPGI